MFIASFLTSDSVHDPLAFRSFSLPSLFSFFLSLSPLYVVEIARMNKRNWRKHTNLHILDFLVLPSFILFAILNPFKSESSFKVLNVFLSWFFFFLLSLYLKMLNFKSLFTSQNFSSLTIPCQRTTLSPNTNKLFGRPTTCNLSGRHLSCKLYASSLYQRMRVRLSCSVAFQRWYGLASLARGSWKRTWESALKHVTVLT